MDLITLALNSIVFSGFPEIFRFHSSHFNVTELIFLPEFLERIHCVRSALTEMIETTLKNGIENPNTDWA